MALHDDANTLPMWLQEVIGSYVSLLNRCDYSYSNHWANAKHLMDDDAKADLSLLNLKTISSQEVADYLKSCTGVVLPTGSLEQHGPVGLIGTDAICVEAIAQSASEQSSILVAPVLSYAPAQFNLGFAGTISLSAETFAKVFTEITTSLMRSGFNRIYVLNGH